VFFAQVFLCVLCAIAVNIVFLCVSAVMTIVV
jgi:hypothetical protein